MRKHLYKRKKRGSCLDGLSIEANVEYGVHHPRHSRTGSRTHWDQERVLRISEFATCSRPQWVQTLQRFRSWLRQKTSQNHSSKSSKESSKSSKKTVSLYGNPLRFLRFPLPGLSELQNAQGFLQLLTELHWIRTLLLEVTADLGVEILGKEYFSKKKERKWRKIRKPTEIGHLKQFAVSLSFLRFGFSGRLGGQGESWWDRKAYGGHLRQIGTCQKAKTFKNIHLYEFSKTETTK